MTSKSGFRTFNSTEIAVIRVVNEHNLKTSDCSYQKSEGLVQPYAFFWSPCKKYNQNCNLSSQKHCKNQTNVIRSRCREAQSRIYILSRLDYCNALFSGLPDSITKSLQLVQNAAAGLITRTRKFDHILSSLHWLPINARSDFKVTYKTLQGLAQSYLQDLIIPNCPSRPRWSSGAGLLSIPK